MTPQRYEELCRKYFSDYSKASLVKKVKLFYQLDTQTDPNRSNRIRELFDEYLYKKS